MQEELAYYSGKPLDHYDQDIHNSPLMGQLVPDVDSEFQDYLSRYNKQYTGGKKEYERRKLNFKSNLFMVRRHNKYEFNKTAGFKLAINFMSDWDKDENPGMF